MIKFPTLFSATSYWLGDTDSLCLNPVVTDDECFIFTPIIQNEVPSAISRFEYYGSWDMSQIDYFQRPKGCFLHTPTNEIYFNTEEGIPTPEDRQLCKWNSE